MSFVAEIQLMMRGFGDCRRPLQETAELIESIVHQQMSSLLNQALDVAEQRNSKQVGPEDILFIMRRDKLKLQRLVNYMAMRDVYPNSASGNSLDEFVVTEEYPRKKICISFLQHIDQTGEYEPVYSSSLYDPVKAERANRLDVLTQNMSSQRYLEFSKERCSSFCPRLRVSKFRDWLLAENSELKLSQHILEMLNFLAYETVAQLVDLALLVKRDSLEGSSELSRYCSPTTLNPDYYPSLLFQQTASFHSTDSGQPLNVGMDHITPDEVREAVRRYWSNNSPLGLFSKNRSPIDTRLLAA